MTIWANTIVHNEENFIWFAIMSVVDYVDKILVYDTGSLDKTVKIIEEIKKNNGDKIIFKKVGKVDKHQFSKIRQRMLDESHCDWILILDGDEIWWEKSIKMVVDTINKKEEDLDAIAVPFYNAVGDIYHYQADAAGRYEILGKRGHLTIRAINRKIQELHIGGSYGSEGYLDKNNVPIQNTDSKRIQYIDAPFLHLTHLKRSTIDDHNKSKYEVGISFPKNFSYPEIFYQPRPKIVESPFVKRSTKFELISLLRLPFVKLKNSITK